MRSSQKEFDCLLEGELESIKAKGRGGLLREGELVVGDYVELEKISSTGEYQIVSCEERRSEIFRIIVRENKKKVTAANCDVLVILTSVSRPAYKRGIIDRFLVRAVQWGIRPVVVFNKMDEYNTKDFDIAFEKRRMDFLGVESFEISALKESYLPQYMEKGLADLRASLQQKTSIFLGQSGVGKSQCIQTFSNGEISLRTNKVGKVGKGAHTTTWSEIIRGGGMSIIDSPGIRSFSLDDIDPLDLMHFFPDLEAISLECQFQGCAHDERAKGCAFYRPQLGENFEIIHSRLDSYKRFYQEISETPFWQKNKYK